MKILNKLTVKSLKLNKKRTLVTIIGIILSTALITVVAGMVTSAKKTLMEYEKKQTGDYHVEFLDVPTEELTYIQNNRNIEEYFLSNKLGYAPLEGSVNEDKPYINIIGFDSVGLEKMPINLREGRMPTNSNEIVISNSIINNANVEIKVGDKMTLDISKRITKSEITSSGPRIYTSGKLIIEEPDDVSSEIIVEGEELNQNNPYMGEQETLEKLYTKEYTVVGIINRLNYDIEPYSAPGYTVITYLDTNNLGKQTNIYTKYTKEGLKNYDEVTKQMSEKAGKEEYTIKANRSLLNYEGVGLNSSYTTMLYTMGAIIITIIIISSVFVIRNSFAISITERTRQYGMLSSIGATKKQIKKNVLFEGTVLGVIAIPLGILLGIFVNLILSVIVNNLINNIEENMVFIYSVPIIAIIFSIILAIVTIYLSCLSSARKATKVSPIDAIRSSADIKIKGNKVKSPRIIKRLFGVGGDIAYKNLKRSKKKYRTTVISIVVSITIFISVTSLVEYGFIVSNIAYKDTKYNLSIYSDKNSESEYKEIVKLDTVKEYSIEKFISATVRKSELKYSEEGKEYMTTYTAEEEKQKEEIMITIKALGEQEYKRYLKRIDLDYEYAKDKIIWIDNFEAYKYKEDGSYKKQIGNLYNFSKGDKIQLLDIKQEEGNNIEVEVAKTTSEKPMGYEMGPMNGTIIVSDEFINKYDYHIGTLYINSSDTASLEKDIKKLYPKSSIFNIDREVKAQKSMILIVAIFLYGFIIVITLIGITNIFNTITSNMNLRSKEFANLKSIGMTKKEFNRMVRLESIFYGTKAILIGVPMGILGSILLFKAFEIGITTGEYTMPLIPILIAIISVFALIGGIMKYSLNKINKQNIIETIRKDNI